VLDQSQRANGDVLPNRHGRSPIASASMASRTPWPISAGGDYYLWMEKILNPDDRQPD